MTRLVVAILVLSACAAVRAQAGEPDIRWRYWEPKLSADIKSSSRPLPGDLLRPDTFGWKKHKSIDRFDVVIPWRSSRLQLSLWEVRYSGSRTQASVVNFNGTQFDAGPLYSVFRLTNYDLRWEFDLFQSGRSTFFSLGFGPLTARYYMRVKGDASGVPHREVVDRDYLVPRLSISAYAISRSRQGNLIVGATVVFTRYAYHGLDVNDAVEVSVFFQYGPQAMVHFGFSRYGVSLIDRSKSTEFRVRCYLDGLFIGASISF